MSTQCVQTAAAAEAHVTHAHGIHYIAPLLFQRVRAVFDYYPEWVAQKPSASFCVPSTLHSLCFRLAVLVAYRCAV